MQKSKKLRPNLPLLPNPKKIEHFYYQLMHITLKNAELLKHSKLDKKGGVLSNLECFNNSAFFNVMFISW